MSTCPSCGADEQERKMRAYQRAQWQAGASIPYPTECRVCEGSNAVFEVSTSAQTKSVEPIIKVTLPDSIEFVKGAEEVKDYRELLIGCGHDRKKRYCAVPHHPRGWRSLRDGISGPVTLDNNGAVKPDLWCDLNQAPPWHFFPRDIPGDIQYDEGRRLYAVGYDAESDYWDEIHAYQVLEHLGRQGDAHAFFSHFAELWRLLKPNGYLVAEVPSRMSGHLWGDPGHTRAIVEESLVFLDQSEYLRQCDGAHPTTMSDYRGVYKADFRVLDASDNRVNFAFVLQAIKPSRWKNPLDKDNSK